MRWNNILNGIFSVSFHSRRKLTNKMKTFDSEKYKYMSKFKKKEECLPNTWIVVRLDGKGFSYFTSLHAFEKPNDVRGIELMNRAAAKVMEELDDVCLAYGQSDEYSFIFKKDTKMLNRDQFRIATIVNSIFSSAYTYYWHDYFGYVRLLKPPAFDSRVVLYPTDSILRDYTNWRQVDVHINNLYNTAFWALVLKGNRSRKEAQNILKDTFSKDKNEILFKDYNTNYNNEPVMFRKGTTLLRKLIQSNKTSEKIQHSIIKLNCDIIKDEFWNGNPELLNMGPVQTYNSHPPLTMFKVNCNLNLNGKPDEVEPTNSDSNSS